MSRWKCSFGALLVTLAPITANSALDHDLARKAILAGVESIHSGVQPGKMAVLGPNAAPVANYETLGDGPMIAAGLHGRGRIIAVPDHQMLNLHQYGDQGDTARFFANGLEWLVGGDATNKVILCAQAGVADYLKANGYAKARHHSKPALHLAGVDLLVGWLGSNLSESEVEAVREFVADGGGLFIADYGAGYQMWWRKPVHEAPGNRILRGTGIGFSNGLLYESGLIGVRPATGNPFTAESLLKFVSNSGEYPTETKAEAAALINNLTAVLPADSTLQRGLDEALANQLVSIKPTPETPVADPFHKALLTREAAILSSTTPRQVVPHRTAELIYGAVPQEVSRGSRPISVNTDRARWLPTGLYAPPGELVRMAFPPDLVGKGYRVRVNAHTGDISRREKWERPPVVHRSFPIDAEKVDVANAFGGSIFVDVGKAAPMQGKQTVWVIGAVEQPHFILGAHTDFDWAQIKDRSAPYAVLEGENLIISLPSEQVSEIDRPEELMRWWDEVVRLQDELAGQSHLRSSPELMNVDVQISAGAAHAGYPYQCYDKYWKNPTDLERLKAHGSWGDYHELGHNHQRNQWWTFSGDVEVTVNLFSAYVLAMLNPNAKGGWAWTLDPDETLRRARESWESGHSYFEEKDLGRRLTFYLILAHEFGWEAIRKVLGGYERDALENPNALPKNENQEKIDQWFMRFCEVVGRDLTPYMRERWGIPVSDSAVAAVSSLPTWAIE